MTFALTELSQLTYSRHASHANSRDLFLALKDPLS
jgi:hypothetical protein